MKRSPLRRKTRLRQVSPSRAARLIKYRKALQERHDQMILEKGACYDEFEGEFAPWEGLESHHPEGRYGDNLFNFKMILPGRHRWIHAHPNQAREKGWLK